MISILSAFRIRLLWMMLLVFALALLFLYVLQINIVTQTTFSMARQEKALNLLRNDIIALETAYAGLLSAVPMETLASTLRFEKSTRVEYIKAGEGAVAQRNSTGQ